MIPVNFDHYNRPYIWTVFLHFKHCYRCPLTAAGKGQMLIYLLVHFCYTFTSTGRIMKQCTLLFLFLGLVPCFAKSSDLAEKTRRFILSFATDNGGE